MAYLGPWVRLGWGCDGFENSRRSARHTKGPGLWALSRALGLCPGSWALRTGPVPRVLVPGPGPWVLVPGPGPWACAQGPGPLARALGKALGPGPRGWRWEKSENPKSFCAVEQNDRDGRYARIDPSRRVIMTEAIFALHKNLKQSKTHENLENCRKSMKNRILLYLGSYFSKWDAPTF